MNKEELQKGINQLVERMLEWRKKYESIKEEKKGLSDEMKSCNTELEAIDKLLKDKMAEMKKLK